MRPPPIAVLRASLRTSTRRRHPGRLYATSSPDGAVGVSDPIGYCSHLVRKHDYESYLISQFWPKDIQASYFAIKAFYVELATVQDHVSNNTIGKMRMQFWRDAVKNIFNGRPPQHPVALALHLATQRSSLQAYHFKRIIDARDAELDTSFYPTIDSLTQHAEATSSTLLYLLLSLLPPPLATSHALSHTASHLGTAQTISTLIRALPYHTRHGRIVIPAEVTSKHGLRHEELVRKGPEAQGLGDAVFEFATLANDHMITARSMLKEEGFQGKVPQAAMPVFLAGVMLTYLITKLYDAYVWLLKIPVANLLQRLEKNAFDAFDPQLQRRDWKLPWFIYRGYYRRQF